MRFFTLKTVTAMNKIKNDLFAVTRNIFHPSKDSRVFFPQNSTDEKTGNPLDHSMQNNETSAFIVDWQLPGIGTGDINKSFS